MTRRKQCANQGAAAWLVWQWRRPSLVNNCRHEKFQGFYFRLTGCQGDWGFESLYPSLPSLELREQPMISLDSSKPAIEPHHHHHLVRLMCWMHIHFHESPYWRRKSQCGTVASASDNTPWFATRIYRRFQNSALPSPAIVASIWDVRYVYP